MNNKLSILKIYWLLAKSKILQTVLHCKGFICIIDFKAK